MLQNKAVSLIILLALISVVALSGCVNKSEGNPLTVTNLEIVPGQIKTSTIELKVTTFIKNSAEGSAAESSKNTSLLLKATSSDRDFLVNQTTTFIGKVAPEKTVNVTQTLTLPKKGGYKLEATLFEEDKEVDRGYRTVYNLDSLPADSKAISLRIDGIDFLVRKAAEDKVVIQSDIYVTNFGAKTSQDYKLMLKATDIDSKLVADKQWSNTGLIAPDETAIRSVEPHRPGQVQLRCGRPHLEQFYDCRPGTGLCAAQCHDNAGRKSAFGGQRERGLEHSSMRKRLLRRRNESRRICEQHGRKSDSRSA